MKSHEKPGPFPFRDRPNVRDWYPDEIAIPEELQQSPPPSLRLRPRKKKEKVNYDVVNIVQGDEENDVLLIADSEDELLSTHQIEQVIQYIKSCCRDESTTEVTLIELEAAFRRHKYANVNKHYEMHCRGLMESLEFLLEENKLTVEGWFRMSDTRGAIGGDGKVTHLELIASIDKLCYNLDLPTWDKKDIHDLLKYMDPSCDSDIQLDEAMLAFRRYRAPPEFLEILIAATSLVDKLEDFMQQRHIRVVDLFRSIDTDNSQTISFRELQRSLQKMFGKKDKSLTSIQIHQRIKTEEENISISADSLNSGWSKFNGMLIKNKPKIPHHILHPKNKFKGYVNNNVVFSSPPQKNAYDDYSAASGGAVFSPSSNSVYSQLSDDESYSSVVTKNSRLSKKESSKKNSPKLQPLEISQSSLAKMLKVMEISGIIVETVDRDKIFGADEPATFTKILKDTRNNDSNQRKKLPHLSEAHYMHLSHPLGLEGESVNVSGVHFKRRLKKDLLNHEVVTSRLKKSLQMEKNRLTAI